MGDKFDAMKYCSFIKKDATEVIVEFQFHQRLVII